MKDVYFVLFQGINVFDKENPHKQVNLQTIAALNKDSRITSLSWGNDNTEILVGRTNNFIKVYDTINNAFTSNIEIDNGSTIGLCRYNEQLIAACNNGTVHVLRDHSTKLSTGDHLSIMRQCKSEPKLIATGGKGFRNCLKVYDLETMQQVFKSKNLPNDFLQLEVPVWDTDVSFIDSTNNMLATCSRYGYIRVYDTRKQRRPIAQCGNAVDGTIKNAKEIPILTYSCMTTKGYNLYVGAATGILHAFDYRKPKSPLHTYKGFTGSISDVGIDESGRFLYTSSLDRFVRVFDAESTHLLYQCYVKSKATKILLKTITNPSDDCVLIENTENSDNDEEVENGNKHLTGDDELDDLFDQMPIAK